MPNFKLLIVMLITLSCNNAHLPKNGIDNSISLELPSSVSINNPIVFQGTCSPDGTDVNVTISGAVPEDVGPCPCVDGSYTCPSVTYTELPVNVNVVASNGEETTSDPNDPSSSVVPVDSLVTVDSISVDTSSPTTFTGTCAPNAVGSINLSIPGATPSTVGACDCVNSSYSCPPVTFSTLPSMVDVTATNSEGYGGPTTDLTSMNIPSMVDITGASTITSGLNTFVGSCLPDGVGTIVISIPGANPSVSSVCDCVGGSFSCDMTLIDVPASPVVTAVNSAGLGGPTTDDLSPSVTPEVDLTNPGNVSIGTATNLAGSCFPSGSDVTVGIAGATPSSVGPCPCVSNTFSCPSVTFTALPANPSFIASYSGVMDTENVVTDSFVDLNIPADLDGSTATVLSGTCAPDGVGTITIGLNTGYVPNAAGPCDCVGGSFTCPSVTFTDAPSVTTITATNSAGDGGPTSDDEDPAVIRTITAVDDVLAGTVAGTATAVSVGTNDPSTLCAPITYEVTNEVNVVVGGTAPNYDVTPTSSGAWKFTYSATCVDGTTDNGLVSGTALPGGVDLAINVLEGPNDNNTVYTNGDFEVCLESYYSDGSNLNANDLIHLEVTDHLGGVHADVELIVGQDPTVSSGYQNDNSGLWASNFVPYINAFNLDPSVLNNGVNGQCFIFSKKKWANDKNNDYDSGTQTLADGSNGNVFESAAKKLTFKAKTISVSSSVVSSEESVDLERLVSYLVSHSHINDNNTGFSMMPFLAREVSGIPLKRGEFVVNPSNSVPMNMMPYNSVRVFGDLSYNESVYGVTGSPGVYRFEAIYGNGMFSASEGRTNGAGLDVSYNYFMSETSYPNTVYGLKLESLANLSVKVYAAKFDQLSVSDVFTDLQVDGIVQPFTLTSYGSRSGIEANFTVSSIGYRHLGYAEFSESGNVHVEEFQFELNYIY